jgi:hypothetical protein
MRKTLLAAAAMFAVATPALAQETSPWDLRERNAYVLDMQGKMWSTGTMTTNAWARMVRHAKPVRHGTVMFMHNGRLYMAQGMFDREGKFMGGGG